MKVLLIDSEYYYFPHGVTNLDELAILFNSHYNKFLRLTKLNSDHTVPPFFIDEFKQDVLVNVAMCSTVEEAVVTVMTKEDYKTSLNNAIDEVCKHCDSFNPQKRCCDCGDIQENMCLNGQCDTFSIDEDDDEEDYM